MKGKIFVVVYILLGILLSSGLGGSNSPSPVIQLYNITVTDIGNDTLLIKGMFTAMNLNSGGIPEQDYVSITVEVKNASDSRYPVFYEGYSIGLGCKVMNDTCISPEEENGVGIQSFHIFGGLIRKKPVWLAYGGLGEWEKNAPDNVTMKFEAKIPKIDTKYGARLHAILTHVVGGPYASWPGISHYHDVWTLDLGKYQTSSSPTNTQTSPTQTGTSTNPPTTSTSSTHSGGDAMTLTSTTTTNPHATSTNPTQTGGNSKTPTSPSSTTESQTGGFHSSSLQSSREATSTSDGFTFNITCGPGIIVLLPLLPLLWKRLKR